MQTHDILFFDSYNVPIKKQLTGNYSYSDFHTRETGNKGRAFKYVYKSDSVVANSVHFIRTQKSDRAERIYRQFARLHKAIRKRTHGGSSALKKLSNYMGKKLRAKFIDPTAEGYFLHYYGITTNWKGAYYDRLTSENSAKPDVAIETEKLENIKRSTRPLD